MTTDSRSPSLNWSRPRPTARCSRRDIGAAGAAARASQASRARAQAQQRGAAARPPSLRHRLRRRPAQPKPQAPLAPAARTRVTGQGRKKKKFFQKVRPPRPQPGNSISGPPQGKRKRQAKGPSRVCRSHGPQLSHRQRQRGRRPALDDPAASNGHSGEYYQDTYAPRPPAPIREDAPTRIFCFIDDLFFLAKIQETARKLGVKVEFVKGDKETVARLTDLPEEERPKLVVFDLNNLNAKPMSLIPKFKTKFKKATSIIGFLNHLQGELKAKAIEAGCDTVMPRSAFSQTLPNLLRRYGVEEEEDHMPQPV